ncbi:MAG TPA: SDR family oxidoreductase, partial [Chromatiales bacterium]|nr:SDR family oxidoreductase [Chromatiales bacterium]
MFEQLKDKVSIVTGAGSGIGRACASLLFEAGAKVIAVDVAHDNLEQLMAELAESGNGSMDNVLSMTLSIRDEDDMQRMADETLARFGRIDSLIASAGILRIGGSMKTLGDTSLDEWNKIIETNLTGTFLSNRAVLPAMIDQREGDIINLSSTSGQVGRPYDGPYCASKFGIIGLSESMAEEVGRHGVRVQAVLPDAVATPFWSQNGPVAMKPPDIMPPEMTGLRLCGRFIEQGQCCIE